MVETPLTTNITSGHSSKAHSENSRLSGSMQGTSITIPVFVQESKGLDTNGSASGRSSRSKETKTMVSSRRYETDCCGINMWWRRGSLQIQDWWWASYWWAWLGCNDNEEGWGSPSHFPFRLCIWHIWVTTRIGCGSSQL